MIKCALAVGLAILLSASPAVMAQEAHTVHFSRGTTGATIQGLITGGDFVDYRLSAEQGQFMDVIVSPDTVYFNVLAPGSSGEALFNSSINGNEFGEALPVEGTYTIRIYQMGAAASEGKSHRFTLDIGID